jgi:hypothetical protein
MGMDILFFLVRCGDAEEMCSNCLNSEGRRTVRVWELEVRCIELARVGMGR